MGVCLTWHLRLPAAHCRMLPLSSRPSLGSRGGRGEPLPRSAVSQSEEGGSELHPGKDEGLARLPSQGVITEQERAQVRPQSGEHVGEFRKPWGGRVASTLDAL